MADSSSDNAALIAAMEKYHAPRVIDVERGNVDKAALVALPKGFDLKAVKALLDEYRTAPERKRGTARLTTLDSFVAHVKRFADEHSALFADDNPKTPKLVGVLNYHEAAAGSPRFGDHRAEYAFPLADEWITWTTTEPMSQREFAEFIEDHIGDVLDPAKAGSATTAFVEQLEVLLASPAQLMTLSKGLSIYVDSRVVNKGELATGEGQIAFSTEHKDAQGAPLKVPRGFAVGVPVFRGGERYSLPIRLRYRVSGGLVSWELKPHRVDAAFRHALTQACTKAAENTNLPLFYGLAES